MESSFRERLDTGLQTGESESWTAKARREVSLLGQGATGFTDAARTAIRQHPGETALKLAGSAVAGLGLSYLCRTSSPLSLAVRVAGTAASLSFLSDVAVRGTSVLRAMSETWQSDENWQHNSSIMKDNLGRFAFDTALLSAAGLAGGAIGYKRFSPWAGKVPEEFTTRLNSTGIRQDYLDGLQPAYHSADIAYNGTRHLSEYKLSLARSGLQESIRKGPTYGEFWKQRIEAYQTANQTRIDAPATMKKFVFASPTTRELNSLSKELKRLGQSDHFDENVVADAYRYLTQIRLLSRGQSL